MPAYFTHFKRKIKFGRIFEVGRLTVKSVYMNDKILVVDDNQDLLMITRIILKGKGYEAFLATSLEEAQRKIKIHQPSLVLLDVCVSDGDGRQLCYQLKSNPQTSNLRIILMSGDDDCGKEIIADDFLPKPFDYNELIQKVDRQLTYATLYH